MTDTVLEKIKRFSNDQYSNEERLNARVQLYRYAENDINLHRWIFQHLDFTGVDSVLDLGCGTGLLWTKNIELVPANIRVMLSDYSDRMVDTCREALGDDPSFSYQVCDAAHTPFESGTYQIVLANHVLNFFEDTNVVFREIERLLDTKGVAYSTAPSTQQSRGIFGIADGFDERLVFPIEESLVNFNAENGEEVLAGFFNEVTKYIFRNDVLIADADTLLLYLASCFEGEQLDLLIERYDDFKRHVESVISQAGRLRITNQAALFRYGKI